MKIHYLTTNDLKFATAQNYFASLEGYELVRQSIEVPEIQHTSCEEIARQSAIYGAKLLGHPCIKMDAGFFISALNGFPGPFVKYVNDWLTEEEYLTILANKNDRRAYFLDATAIGFPDGSSEVFTRRFKGRVAERDNYIPTKWPANSLFIPDGHKTPLGMWSTAEQEKYWYGGVWPQVVSYLKLHSSIDDTHAR